MNIFIQGWDKGAAQDIPTHVKNRIYQGLGPFTGRLQRVTVRLRDLNGPKGGLDKHCQIHLTLRGGGNVVVENRNSCWLDVIDAAAFSAGRAIERLLSRPRGSRAKAARRD